MDKGGIDTPGALVLRCLFFLFIAVESLERMDEAGPAVADSPALHQDLSEEEALLVIFRRAAYSIAQICDVLEHSHGLMLTLQYIK